MIDFKLNYPIPPSQVKIGQGDFFFLAGSCFAEHLFSGLKAWRFPSRTISNGILFNPISIANGLNSILDETDYGENDLVEEDGIFLSRFHHGSVYGLNKNEFIEKLNQLRIQDLSDLKSSRFLVVSFGTAKVWKHNLTDKIVANCHKEKAQHFSSYLLSIDAIVSEWKSLLVKLSEINPNLRVILTVSPVKYIRDGLHQNNISKSILLLAIENLCETFEFCHYFPSFEIVNDELRDYRFYENDFAHPTKQAIEYVLNRFKETWMENETLGMIRQIEQLNKRENHRFLHPEAESAQLFQTDNRNLRKEIQLRYPKQDWSY